MPEVAGRAPAAASSVPAETVVLPPKVFAPVSVRTPVPALVREPVAPLTTPAKVVLVLSPPATRPLAPSTTEEPAAPASEPTVMEAGVIAETLNTAVPPETLTAEYSEISPAPERAKVPAVTVVEPE